MLLTGKLTLKWKAAHKILENLLVFRNVVWFLFYAGQFYWVNSSNKLYIKICKDYIFSYILFLVMVLDHWAKKCTLCAALWLSLQPRSWEPQADLRGLWSDVQDPLPKSFEHQGPHIDLYCRDKKGIGSSGICENCLEKGKYFESLVSLLPVALVWGIHSLCASNCAVHLQNCDG